MNQVNNVNEVNNKRNKTLPTNFLSLCYYHITYFGSIASSGMIWFLLFGFTQCNNPYHIYIYNLMKLKCLFLYDSTNLEYLHHLLQYIVICVIKPTNNMICTPNIMEFHKIGYSVLTTPIFNNIKVYYNPSSQTIRTFLDAMTFLCFFYYRYQWNYCYLLGNGVKGINEYINYNVDPLYQSLSMAIVHPIIFIFCMMNFYWGVKIIQKASKNILNSSYSSFFI